MRADGRATNQLRPIAFTPHYLNTQPHSVLVQMGNTWVLCVATVEESLPPWLRGKGQGWVTAEYGLLPASTTTRTQREAVRGQLKGRTHEIQRLVGRSLRAAVDLTKLGERMIIVDCDVIQADGGTRTASITGGYVALAMALTALVDAKRVPRTVWRPAVAAVSAGIVQGTPMLDLSYIEDSQAEVDLNVVMNERGQYVEVQGTAEGQPFDRQAMNHMLDLTTMGIKELLALQKAAIVG